jgi:hypothetical protein
MIISLEEAKKSKPDVTQEELDAIEIAIRGLTNNKFQNLNVRFFNFEVQDSNKLVFNTKLAYLRVGDTIEISDTWAQTGFGQNVPDGVNDGLFVIKEITDNSVILDTELLFDGRYNAGFITKIEYPADIAAGIHKMLKYDAKMGAKLGIKSESISRMSVSYFDVSTSSTIEGFPASVMSFLKKYEKMRW